MSNIYFTAYIDGRGRRLRTVISENVLPSKLRSAVYIACWNTSRKLLLYNPHMRMRIHYKYNVAC